MYAVAVCETKATQERLLLAGIGQLFDTNANSYLASRKSSSEGTPCDLFSNISPILAIKYAGVKSKPKGKPHHPNNIVSQNDLMLFFRPQATQQRLLFFV
jgi:hypothetical protein